MHMHMHMHMHICTCTYGVVHAWVGQILLNCDVFKRVIGGTPWVHALKHSFSSGGCAFSVESGMEPNKTVPDPVRGSSLYQATTKQRGQGGRLTATHHHGYRHCTPQAAHGHCRARNDMAATQRRYRGQRQR
jgi:hypothetical protein